MPEIWLCPLGSSIRITALLAFLRRPVGPQQHSGPPGVEPAEVISMLFPELHCQVLPASLSSASIRNIQPTPGTTQPKDLINKSQGNMYHQSLAILPQQAQDILMCLKNKKMTLNLNS